MPKHNGRNVVISINTTGVTWVPIGGARSKGITINNGTIDTSDSDSSGEWRERIAGGLRDFQVTVSGVCNDSAGEVALVDMATARTVRGVRILVPDMGTFEGQMIIQDWSTTGEYEDASQYTCTFISAGALTFTAAA